MAWMVPTAITASALIGANASKGGGSQQTTNEPWYYQQPYLRDLFAKTQAAQTSGQLGQVAPLDPLQLLGQEGILNTAQTQLPQIANQAMGGYSTLLNAANVNNNPVLQQYIQAALRPLTQQYEQGVLPGIRADALATGNYGGTRQGVAEGIAGQELLKQSGDVTTNITNNAYNTGLQALLGAISQGQNLTGLALAPSVAVGSVGAERQAQAQAQLNQPQNALQIYQQLIGGNYGGTTTAPGATGNPVMGALGGALIGNNLQNLWNQNGQRQQPNFNTNINSWQPQSGSLSAGTTYGG